MGNMMMMSTQSFDAGFFSSASVASIAVLFTRCTPSVLFACRALLVQALVTLGVIASCSVLLHA
jgi:hypothetical protein